MWAKREFTAKQYDEAGDALRGGAAPPDKCMAIINNWRATHAYPLNTFQMTLRTRAKAVDPNALVAQRIKRLVSIRPKLHRFRLTEIQDIAGCRAVVSTMSQVDALVARYKDGSFKHDLDHEDDYIRAPKRSGYRGVHLIFRYYSDKKATYNGLKVEMQFRSIHQHAWATAVETVGLFTGDALKSSQGNDDWLHFFKLMGSFIALREKSTLVPDMPPTRKALRESITDYEQKLNARGLLGLLPPVVQYTSKLTAGSGYFLLQLDPKQREVTVTPYKKAAVEQASQAYLFAEQTAVPAGKDVVLVSVDSVYKLKKAYPNYFLDTARFLREVNRAVLVT